MSDSPKIGLIAGYGSFPLEVAEEFNRLGYEVHAVAVRDETSPEIESLTASTCWLHVGQIGSMIKAFRHAGVTEVVMAGKIRKLLLFRNFRPDFVALKGLLRMPDRKDDSIMTAVTNILADAGISVLSQVAHAGDMIASQGHLFGPKPSRKNIADMKFGFTQAKGIAGLDIGQTVVVQEKAVLAVEAIEGTDEAIRRGGELGSGKAVVVKVAKPDQDLRFDVPAFGPDTLEVMHASGCTALAVEAGLTLMLERHRIGELAQKYGISVYGMNRDESDSG
ncbi:MAG: UDP-2,3-diacylglucosamine diphosphatase LpxI [Mariprofundaceae bacterium]|nr:UDP-2,3-diacylglucosamine diphosphatase LpxI [Mariprofundaceae bacterium]